MRSRLGLALLTLLLAPALLQPLKFLHLVFLNFSVGDEGVLLAGAMRILRGQHPYRDFFVFHAPGPFYLIAGWMHLFGTTLASARWLAWLINALLLMGLMGLAHGSKLSRPALAVIMLAQLAVGFAFFPILNHHWMANAFLVLSAGLLVASEGGQRIGWLVGAGAMAGVSVLMLQDEGGYWILLVALLMLFSGGRRRWARTGAFLLGVGVAAGPMAANLLMRMKFSRIVDSILLVPVKLYHAHPGNRAAWGQGWLIPFRQLAQLPAVGARGMVGVSTLAQGLGLVVIQTAYPAAALLVMLRVFRLRTLPTEQRWQWRVLACFAAALGLMALHRPTILNLGLAFPGPLMLILWELERLRERHPRWASGVSFACLAAPLTFTALGYSLLFPYLGPSTTFHLPAGRLESHVPAEHASWALLREFRSRFYQPGDTVFCYSYCSFYYFVLQIPNPTGYDNLDLARYDPDMAAQLLAELSARSPDWLLLDGRYGTAGRKDPVVDWASGRYKVIAKTEFLLIARKKSQPNTASPR